MQQGRPPDTSANRQFLDLMKGKDWYGGDSNSVESYDKSRLKLLQGRVTPRPIRPMLPASSQRFLSDPKKYIPRSEQQLEELRDSGAFRSEEPYWDPVLKHNRAARIDFIKSLEIKSLEVHEVLPPLRA